MTFIQQLLKGSTPATYPPSIGYVPGSLALRRDGVHVILDIYEHWTYVVRIRVPKARAGKGDGSAALRWLCRTADRHNVELHLHPSANAHEALTNRQLRAWYKRHGFRSYKSGLIREPRRRDAK